MCFDILTPSLFISTVYVLIHNNPCKRNWIENWLVLPQKRNFKQKLKANHFITTGFIKKKNSWALPGFKPSTHVVSVQRSTQLNYEAITGSQVSFGATLKCTKIIDTEFALNLL